jgi:hypothetical protein
VQRLWLSGSVLRQELGEILGRPVDLVERQCVEHSNNWIRRRHILESAQTFYVARWATLLDIALATRRIAAFVKESDVTV